MADEEHLAILRQGSAAWNAWRHERPDIIPGLFGATRGFWAALHQEILAKADFAGANLYKANLSRASLATVHFGLWANLCQANLAGADLAGADFGVWANLAQANLAGADLAGASLVVANLRGADLAEANLVGANLVGANLVEANLSGANLSEACLWETVFANLDLSATKGLETCAHMGPSIIDHRALQRSGRLPLAFLRGCGLPDRLIDDLPSLLEEAIQYYSCFISYSSKDDAFVKRLHVDLQNRGVRCWFAPHDLPIGAKTWDAIDEAIRLRDKLLLILSENAIASNWVEDEVTKAFAEERRRNQVVLFPVRIDDAVVETTEAWAVKLRDQRNIGDFRKWKDHDAYQQAFACVLRHLKAPPG